MSKETKLPAIPNSSDPSVKALKEATEIRLGRRGDPLDRGVTVRDLYEGGVVKLKGKPDLTSGVINAGLGTIIPKVIEGDLTTPPPPTTLTASAGGPAIALHWDQPLRTDVVTHIYRNTVDDRSTAVVIGMSVGNYYADTVGHGYTYYYWVRYVSINEVSGPFNAVAGTVGITSEKVSDIIERLSDELSQSHLAVALSTKIDKIDVIEGGLAEVVTESATLVSTTATLNTTVSGFSATIQSHTGSINGVIAEQFVKINANGAISGYGLAANAGGSEFAVLADVFKISHSDGSKIAPFIVTDGVTYINNAMINMATIQWADIPTLNTHLLTVTGPMVADTIDATLLDGDTIIANVSITAPAINGGSITAASINGSTITGGIINGVLVLAGAVALVTEFGAPHYAYDSGVYFDFSNSTNVGGNHLLGVSGNIKPYNYHLYAHSGSTVKNSTSNLFRYRKQSITPEMHCHVQYNQVGGLINANYVALQTHFWVRAGIRTSAGTTLTYSDFAITSFFDGPQQGMRNRQIVQTDSSGIYQYTLNYQFHSSSGSDGFTTYNYHMLGSQTLSIYAAHIGGATGLNFNESTSIKCEAFVQIFNFNGANTSIGTKSIRMHDVADNSG